MEKGKKTHIRGKFRGAVPVPNRAVPVPIALFLPVFVF